MKNDISSRNVEDATELALDRPLWRLLAASGAMHWICAIWTMMMMMMMMFWCCCLDYRNGIVWKIAGFVGCCIGSDDWRGDGPCWCRSWRCWSRMYTSYYGDTDCHRFAYFSELFLHLISERNLDWASPTKSIYCMRAVAFCLSCLCEFIFSILQWYNYVHNHRSFLNNSFIGMGKGNSTKAIILKIV